MKTIQELYEEVKKDKRLLAELLDAIKAKKHEEFFKAHGCNATTKEAVAFIKTKLYDDDFPISLDMISKLL